jgi:hypothetical protein
MAKVIYDSKNTNTTFNDLKEGDYFDYEGSLFLFVDDSRGGLVFDLEEGYSFYWCDEFNADTPVLIINPSRITIEVD